MFLKALYSLRSQSPTFKRKLRAKNPLLESVLILLVRQAFPDPDFASPSFSLAKSPGCLSMWAGTGCALAGWSPTGLGGTRTHSSLPRYLCLELPCVTGLTGTDPWNPHPSPIISWTWSRCNWGHPMARGKHLPGSAHEGGVGKPCPPSPCACVGLGMPKRTPEPCMFSSMNANNSLTKISGTYSLQVIQSTNFSDIIGPEVDFSKLHSHKMFFGDLGTRPIHFQLNLHLWALAVLFKNPSPVNTASNEHQKTGLKQFTPTGGHILACTPVPGWYINITNVQICQAHPTILHHPAFSPGRAQLSTAFLKWACCWDLSKARLYYLLLLWTAPVFLLAEMVPLSPRQSHLAFQT